VTETRRSAEVTAVEGRDPDGLVVLVVYPGPDQVPLHELPVRIYGYTDIETGMNAAADLASLISWPRAWSA
jgi:hypothetical protein